MLNLREAFFIFMAPYVFSFRKLGCTSIQLRLNLTHSCPFNIVPVDWEPNSSNHTHYWVSSEPLQVGCPYYQDSTRIVLCVTRTLLETTKKNHLTPFLGQVLTRIPTGINLAHSDTHILPSLVYVPPIGAILEVEAGTPAGPIQFIGKTPQFSVIRSKKP